MISASPTAIDFISVGYSPFGARWVFRGRGRWGLGKFFGRAGSMLARGSVRPGRVEAPAGDLGPSNSTHGFLPFSGGRRGDVADRYVAAPSESVLGQCLSERGSLTANLWTGRPEGGDLGRDRRHQAAIGAGSAGGASPLSARDPGPHARRARRTGNLETFRAKAPHTDSRSADVPNREPFMGPTGSGERARSGAASLARESAESGSGVTGLGKRGDHIPLDAGKPATLGGPRIRVNSSYPIPMHCPSTASAAGHRAGQRASVNVGGMGQVVVTCDGRPGRTLR